MNEKIAIVIGTRAELIKTFPVMQELKSRRIDYYFIHTGQHNLKDLCRDFSVKSPDVVLTKEPKKSSKFYSRTLKAIIWNLLLVFKIKKELGKLKNLKYVLYHGDTMTTASTAIASSRLLNPFKKYENVHLEAGLRSEDLFEPFPEEISRIIADSNSDILFAVSERAEKNLERYKKRKKIYNVGNTIVDSASIAYKLALKKKVKALSNKKFAIISIHRHENIKNRRRLFQIAEILSQINVQSFFPLHDNTKKQLMKFGFYDMIIKNKNINIIEPMDYVEFIYQISKCSMIICDGGSLQEESLIFKKPCIILRKATERQEGLNTNFQFLSDLDIDKTVEKINLFSGKNFKVKDIENPYGKIGVSKKVVDLIK